MYFFDWYNFTANSTEGGVRLFLWASPISTKHVDEWFIFLMLQSECAKLSGLTGPKYRSALQSITQVFNLP